MGPSAGWFLPRQFIARFAQIDAYDIDLGARHFFFLRHRRKRGICWHFLDFQESLERILHEHPTAAMLFCNVLGQLGVENPGYEMTLQKLPGLLTERHWASFHDRYSTRDAPVSSNILQPFTTREAMSAAMLHRLGGRGTWTDHGTGCLLDGTSTRSYFPWWIGPQEFHWVEAFTIAPKQ